MTKQLKFQLIFYLVTHNLWKLLKTVTDDLHYQSVIKYY